nr:MAG TPA: hypothetical protein [Caudoviricetes sp.]
MILTAKAPDIVKKKPYVIRINGIRKKGIRRGYIKRIKSKSIKKCYFLSFYAPPSSFLEEWAKYLIDSIHTSENNHHES